MAQATGKRARPPGPITSVEVTRLFDKFNYRIELSTSKRRRGTSAAPLFASSQDRLTLIYGKNGTGKTTLLRLLYHALSAASDRGHWAALYGARFERLTVQFAAGSTVVYAKNDDDAEGQMAARIEHDGESADWAQSGARRREELLNTTYATMGGSIVFEPDAQLRRFHAMLDALGVNPVFLADTRVLESDLTERDASSRTGLLASRVSAGFHVDQLVEQQRDKDLTEALERVRRYLSQLVFTGAQRGSERVDTVYTNLVETLVEHAYTVGRPRVRTIPDLIERIVRLGRQAELYAHYGLVPQPPVRRLVRGLEQAQKRHGPLLEQVLNPYLAGIEQRLSELEVGLHAIASYIDTLNSFFEEKTVTFSPPSGVVVADQVTGEQLAPGDLSSGEKQILLLFSDVVALQETTRLFIIDEPELSLNPNWQRMLIPALLSATGQSDMQIVAATHSIEMMAPYRSRIKALEKSEAES